ncbi:uncharacterized protein LOC132402627 isoform X2 [Hypanus sabinus]|uniref:uncharacterized protein LOC132402627 isoform X2 n=1 Tax=Hypanus sabinus TaxID=79690 RepID=UPI0028C44EC9|nr:uncharacterized protein LOC132402627 isoform X2 [Hypanus sabinus]
METSTHDRKRLQRIVDSTSLIISTALHTTEDIFKRRCLGIKSALWSRTLRLIFLLRVEMVGLEFCSGTAGRTRTWTRWAGQEWSLSKFHYHRQKQARREELQTRLKHKRMRPHFTQHFVSECTVTGEQRGQPDVFPAAFPFIDSMDSQRLLPRVKVANTCGHNFKEIGGSRGGCQKYFSCGALHGLPANLKHSCAVR